MAAIALKQDEVAVIPPAPPPEASSVLPPGMRVIVTVTLLAATFMEVVDTSIVNVALPNMQGKLGVTLDEVSWVSTAYIISNVIFLPLTAWLSDLFGRRRYLAYSLVLFTAASFGCGVSSTLGELVLFRFLQGAGGAAFLSTSQATLIEIYPKHLQGVAQAIFGMGVVMAPTVGPTIGGYLTDNYSWPWIFFVNLPVGVLAIALTVTFVPNAFASRGKRSADLVGIGFLAVGLGALQTVLERGERDDWFEAPEIVALVSVSAVTLALFAWWELRDGNRAPAVDLRLITNRNLLVGSLYAGILGFLLYGSIFAVPQFLQGLQRHTAQQTGMLLLPGGLATIIGMGLVSRLIRTLDPRILVGGGMACYLASSLLFANRLTLDTEDGAYLWPLILRGLGFGLAFVPLSLISLGTLKPAEVAQGAGLYNLARQLGGSFGIALLTTVLSRRATFHGGRLREHLAATDPHVLQRLQGVQHVLVQRGLSATEGEAGALKALLGALTRQAYLMAFVDVFRALSVMAAVGLVLVFLFRKSRGQVSAGAAH